MVKTLVTIRTARETDAEGIAEVHDAAWREAYLGVIPGRELQKMVTRRGPNWWLSAIKPGIEAGRPRFRRNDRRLCELWAQSASVDALCRRDFRTLSGA